MRHIFTVLIFLSFLPVSGQVRIFSGSIGKYPVQLATYTYSGGDTRAIYAYDSYDTPIIVNGMEKNDSLILTEYDETGRIAARLVFHDIHQTSDNITGLWIDQKKPAMLGISLNRVFEFDAYDTNEFENRELMQPESTTENYFRLLISKKRKGDLQVSGVRIYEKKTDRLIQEIELDCMFWGLDNVSTGDYNFDGYEDFSVFESSYAGPNTSSVYILRDPASDQYFISEISGISLEFDPDTRLIYEHNQCCAGSMHMYATYKLVDNEMVLVEMRCTEYDEELEDFIERACD